MTADGCLDHRHPYPFDERMEVVPFIPRDVRNLLDVGSSRGGFGAAIRRSLSGVHLVAIEQDQTVSSEAQPFYDEVIVGSFPEAITGRDRSFDCIVFNDVLEHMIDPWTALRSAAALLADRGVVVAAIPNVRTLRNVVNLAIRGNWTYTEMGILDRTHLRFFTKRSISKLFEEAGYTIDRVEGIFPLGGRWKLAPLLTRVLRDVAFLEFVVVARPRR